MMHIDGYSRCEEGGAILKRHAITRSAGLVRVGARGLLDGVRARRAERLVERVAQRLL